MVGASAGSIAAARSRSTTSSSLTGIREDAQIGDAALERLLAAIQVEDADPRAVVLDPGVGDQLLQGLLRVWPQAMLDPGVAPGARLGALPQERERPAPERRVGVEPEAQRLVAAESAT